MKLGDAFTMAVPPRFRISHLFFVISDPLRHGAEFVVVNITTDHIRAGEECFLSVGDHPWITKKSFLSFRDAILIDAKKEETIQGLVGTLVTMHSPLTGTVLKRIVDSAKASRSIPQTLKEFL
jgi:hypothetical protein